MLVKVTAAYFVPTFAPASCCSLFSYSCSYAPVHLVLHQEEGYVLTVSLGQRNRSFAHVMFFHSFSSVRIFYDDVLVI